MEDEKSDIDVKDKENLTFGDRIKHIIESENITHSEFAKMICVKNSYISQVIQGNGNFNDSTIKLICIIYKVNEDWLRYGIGNMSINKNIYSKQMETLIRFFECLNPEFKEAAIKYFKYLLKLQLSTNKQIKQWLKIDD